MGRADPESALSTARRLYAPVLPAVGVELALGSDAAQHARVLRLAMGDELELFDGRGGSARARIARVDRGQLTCVGITPRVELVRPYRVTLVQCVPKAGKLDDLVRMTTELGVAEIALAYSEHCVVRPSGRDEHKLERLERIAVEAARQSEQAHVPTISPAAPLSEVLARVPTAAYRAACVERTQRPLPTELHAQEVWLVIGPEGGLSAGDRAALSEAKFDSIALGPTILRTETAAVVGVALALERLGRRC